MITIPPTSIRLCVLSFSAAAFLQSCGPSSAEFNASKEVINARYDYLVGQSYPALARQIGAPTQIRRTSAGTVHYYNRHYPNSAFEAGYPRVFEQPESPEDRMMRTNVNANRAMIGSPFAPSAMQLTLSADQARREAERMIVCGLSLTVNSAGTITKVEPAGTLWKTPGLTPVPSSCADRLDRLVSRPGA